MARAMEKPIIQGDKHTSMLTYNKVTVAPAKYVCMTTMNIVTFLSSTNHQASQLPKSQVSTQMQILHSETTKQQW